MNWGKKKSILGMAKNALVQKNDILKYMIENPYHDTLEQQATRIQMIIKGLSDNQGI